MSTHAAVTEFLFEESAALDETRYGDWLDLLTEDFRYEVPQPITPQSPDEPQYTSRMPISSESKGSLRMRFDRMSSEYAWADRPKHFLRHFVSNIRVRRIGDDVWEVRSNVLVARSRTSEETVLATAGRLDVLHGNPKDGFRLAARTVHLDVEVPSAAQLAPIY
ncbi:hypothetical protein GCM10023205_68680 [Yinghuangia aomiensis]|uniref:3-phenylpropionate/cinnamic acid dioxygenase, small subunit n=1 Tax=Yinghuangia aomiensis TaxID=676205 RepID=A0ABP9I5U3_9ACTN